LKPPSKVPSQSGGAPTRKGRQKKRDRSWSKVNSKQVTFKTVKRPLKNASRRWSPKSST